MEEVAGAVGGFEEFVLGAFGVLGELFQELFKFFDFLFVAGGGEVAEAVFDGGGFVADAAVDAGGGDGGLGDEPGFGVGLGAEVVDPAAGP